MLLLKIFLTSWIIGVFLMADVAEKLEARKPRIACSSTGIILSGAFPNGYILANLIYLFGGFEPDEVLLRSSAFAAIIIFLNIFSICFILNFSMKTSDFYLKDLVWATIIFVAITFLTAILVSDHMTRENIESFLIYL